MPDAATPLARLFLQEDLNFLITNRIPRRAATQLLAWYSHIESPALTRASIAAWQLFAGDLRLEEAKKQRFSSLHDCFTRELRDDARPIDPALDVAVSPCDAEVGALGRLDGDEVIQAKGFPYSAGELLTDAKLLERHRGGLFVTLRLKSSMYHRFHAPMDCRVKRVLYISGDTWNVNPIALKRVERLFCKNERAVLDLQVNVPGLSLTLVPIAAILVGSIKLSCLERPLDLKYAGPRELPCDMGYAKGQELGYFAAGSTIVAFAAGPVRFASGVVEGATLRVGEPLFKLDLPLKGEPT
jgi:phosphatidylserine decarboxylase